MLDQYRFAVKLAASMSQLHEEHDHHGAHVAGLARQVAMAQGLPLSAVALIEIGAHLHDIGKLRLPSKLLNVPRKLTPAEMVEIQKHTTLGWAIVDQADFAPAICEIVRHHHECYDGNGYPDRLAGQQIPLGARIVAICDVYAAMITQRPHRPPFTQAFAQSYLQAGKGQVFDPDLVDLFVAVVAKAEA